MARIVAGAAVAMLLLGLEPEGSRLMKRAEARTAIPRTIPVSVAPVRAAAANAVVLSGQARRYLALQFKVNATEFMGCMIGERRGNIIVVQRIAPTDVDSAQSTATHVLPKATCEESGWVGTIGMVHSHPNAKSCWYYFPGTQVTTSDYQSFVRQPYPVDAIMCGDTLVWIGRDYQERRIPFQAQSNEAAAPPAPKQPSRGNQVAAGAPN
ncbi:MAG TPA: hypothetical protein VE091_10390 [Gemmatimonadales bacterium]|nr:hypothetical protein [Gemmatimonadales bacterium]